MEERKTIFDYLAQTFCMFGIMVVLLSVFCLLFGESAREISTMFVLGKEGLSIATLGQYMIVAILVTAGRALFFTDYVIRNKSLAFRTAGMMGTMIGVIVLCIFIWDWFPVDMWQPWVMFVICFVICALVSTLVVAWKEKMENHKMKDALERLKKEGVEADGI